MATIYPPSTYLQNTDFNNDFCAIPNNNQACCWLMLIPISFYFQQVLPLQPLLAPILAEGLPLEL